MLQGVIKPEDMIFDQTSAGDWGNNDSANSGKSDKCVVENDIGNDIP